MIQQTNTDCKPPRKNAKVVITKLCPICETSFDRPSYKQSETCSKTCAQALRVKRNPTPKIHGNCMNCGKPFACKPSRNQKTCGAQCYHEYRNNDIHKECPICGTGFSHPPNKPKLTCSRTCTAHLTWQRGDHNFVKPIEAYEVGQTIAETHAATYSDVSCEQCGEKVEKRDKQEGHDRYCSPECATHPEAQARQAEHANATKKELGLINPITIHKVCPCCDTVFQHPAHSPRTYCSQKCSMKPESMAQWRKKAGLGGFGGHKVEYRGHTLDSGWEHALAIRLDELGVLWSRGQHELDWHDGVKERAYQPDFYLIDHDVFLEVKSKHLAKLNKAENVKINYIKKNHPKVYFIWGLAECKSFNMEKIAHLTQK